MAIVGILGFIGSGKGSVGNILESDYGFKKDSFAAPLKDAVSAIFGWDRDLLEGDSVASRQWRETLDPWWEKRIEGMTPRYALQLMGTEAGRNIFDSNIWLYSLERRLLSGNDYVITDVRFPNEMKFLKELGGKLIRVKRGPEPLWLDYAAEWNFKNHSGNLFQVMDKYPNIHYSEFAFAGYPVDYIIENEGTLEDLRTKITPEMIYATI